MARISPRLRNVALLVAVVLVSTVFGVIAVNQERAQQEKLVDSHPVAAGKAWSSTGPALGTYRRDYRKVLSSDEDQQVVTLAGPHVVVATREGLQAYDARTGEASWRYREKTESIGYRELIGVSVTAGVVVAGFEAGIIPRYRMVGLDARTGERLWDNHKKWKLTQSGADTHGLSGPDTYDAAAGIVLAVDDDGRYVGVDARTGKREWRTKVADDGSCTRPEKDTAGGNGAVLPFTACGGDIAGAVDARTGAVLWNRSTDPNGLDPVIRTSGPMALVSFGAGRGAELVGRDGKVRSSFTGRPGPRPSYSVAFDSIRMYSVGDRTVVAYQAPMDAPHDDESDDGETYTPPLRDLDDGDDVPYQDAVYVLDRSSGKSSRRVLASRVEGTWAVAGDRMYAVTRSLTFTEGTALVPVGLAVLDVADARIDQAPLPRTSLDRDPDDRGLLPSVLGAGDGRLLVLDESGKYEEDNTYQSVLSSYRVAGTTSPTELGGVPTTDWPDPCKLLPKDHGPRKPGAAKHLGGVTLPHTACRNDQDSVRVVWVAPTEQEAAALVTHGNRSSVGADEERYLDGRGVTLLRVGRVIVEWDTNPDTFGDSAKSIVRRLRAAQR